MSCTCQGCGKQYRVDLVVPDALWERIKPAGKATGAGLLCGCCIMNRVEALGEYGALVVMLEPSAWHECLRCGKPANPELKLCPACEHELRLAP